MTSDTPVPGSSAPSGDRLLTWRAVHDLTGISRTTVWRLQNAGVFPKPVVISPGRVGWRESEVRHWTANLGPRGTLAPRQRGRAARRSSEDRAPTSDRATALPQNQQPADSKPPDRSRRRPRPNDPAQITFDF